jgi:predicted Ser/Thr protein kinase
VLPASETAARPKRRIGKYVVLGRIGRGGMGMVYRGHDEVLEREVAVKTLTLEGSLDEESRRRFEIEAKSAARLQHQNIVTVYELGEDRGFPFIAMELLPGSDLLSLMRSGEPLTLQEKLDTVIQVCRGLEYAHEHGIVHRDIKPANIHLLDDGTVKIMDFGIAKLGGTSLTKSGMMIGTVHYMSPEQIRAKPLDGRSDVFSLGVILYELLAGRRPYPGDDATAVLYKIVHEAPDPLEELGPLGEKLAPIVARALARDRDGRFPSAAAFADALGEVLSEHVARHLSTATAADLEAVAAARRLMKEGQLDEASRRIEQVLARSPEFTEALRALRAVGRERQRRQKPVEAEAQDFPELDATFQSPQTGVQPGTLVQPTLAQAQPASLPLPRTPGPAGSGGWRLLVGAGLALVIAAAAGLLLMRRGAETPATANPPAPSVAAKSSSARELAPLAPAAAGPAAHDPAAPRPVAALPLTPKLAPIEPALPSGSVTIEAAYPLDVVWKGKLLASGQTSPTLSLPAGRQTLSLVSEKYFLRTTLTLDVKAGDTASASAPGLGKISIRANPDNCEVSIDGVFLDYPPILDRAIAAGTRTVSFKWPDGGKREETVEIAAGRLVYVMGRKD